MSRHLSLRQIEGFKAVMDSGTVSEGAAVLGISQPAMSRLIAHLEFDTGLHLFDRVKGRLAPTEKAMRLYEEIERVFAGVRQVESAVIALRREELGRLTIGVVPVLAGSFIQRATTGFLKARPNVFCSVQSLSSPFVIDRVVSRTFDIGLTTGPIDNPYLQIESLMEHALVCVMPPDHPLAAKRQIEPHDLDSIPFVAFNADSPAGRQVEEMFAKHAVKAEIALVASAAPTVCEFVAAGRGVSLVHPLMIGGLEDRLVARPFEPKLVVQIYLCRSAENRNARLISAFSEELRAVAAQISGPAVAAG